MEELEELEKAATESRLNYLERLVEQLLPHLPEHWRERYRRAARGYAGGKASPRKAEPMGLMEKIVIHAISAESLKGEDDDALLHLHQHLHALWSQHFADTEKTTTDGISREDLVNAHIFVRDEVVRRKMKHSEEPRDSLDEAAGELAGKAAKTQASSEIMVVRDAVCVVGSSAKGKEGADLDVLLRLPDKDANPHLKPLCESIELQVRTQIDPDKECEIHWIYNESGSHGDFVPKFHLMLVPTSKQELVEVKKHIALPFTFKAVGDGPDYACWLVETDANALGPEVVEAEIATLDKVLREEETRGEVAAKLWAKNWHKLVAKGQGKFILHGHFPALAEEEKGWPLDKLLRAGKAYHTDLRHQGPTGLWGYTNYEGKSDKVGSKGTRLHEMPAGKPMRGGFKPGQPKEWIDVGKRKPYISEEVGKTGKDYSKFFALDFGGYKLTFAREHSFEVVYDGKKGVLDGRYQMSYVPIEGGRVWMISRPADQDAIYADDHKLETVAKELRKKGQKWLFWRESLDAPLKKLDVKDVKEKAAFAPDAGDVHVPSFVRGKPKNRGRLEKSWCVPIVKVEESKRLVYGIVLEPDESDAHGDVVSADEIEKAAHRFLMRSRKMRLEHKKDAEDVHVVESFVAPKPDLYGPGKPKKAGAWILGTYIGENAEDTWRAVKRGELSGYSIGGFGKRRKMKTGGAVK